VQGYVEGLRPSAAIAMRQGYAAALGALPACLLRQHALEVLVALGNATQVSNKLVCSCIDMRCFTAHPNLGGELRSPSCKTTGRNSSKPETPHEVYQRYLFSGCQLG
jgi:hypothetical protein